MTRIQNHHRHAAGTTIEVVDQRVDAIGQRDGGLSSGRRGLVGAFGLARVSGCAAAGR